MKASAYGMTTISEIFKISRHMCHAVFRITPQPSTPTEKKKQRVTDAITQGVTRIFYCSSLIMMFMLTGF